MSANDLVDDLGENVVGALAYSLGFVTGILCYVLVEENPFVRFHAVQSIVVFAGLLVLSFGINLLLGIVLFIPVVGGVFATLFGFATQILGLAGLVVWVLLMVKAYQGERYELPVAGPLANDYA